MLVCVNCKGDVVGLHEVARGDRTTCIISPAEVYKRALLNNAQGIVVAHNHPSGDPKPSAEDFKATERLLEAGELLGVKLLDHIIVAAGGEVSLKETTEIF